MKNRKHLRIYLAVCCALLMALGCFLLELSPFSVILCRLLQAVWIAAALLCTRWACKKLYPLDVLNHLTQGVPQNQAAAVRKKMSQMEPLDAEPLAAEIAELLLEEMGSGLQLEVLKKQIDVEILQRQIQPHFLYNTLDSIRGQAIADGAYEIADMTKALSKFFHYSIDRTGDLVSLQDELQNVTDYCKIQQFRFSNRFTLSIEYAPEDENVLRVPIPKFTLQPLVENAILHGLSEKLEHGLIQINLLNTGSAVLIQCSDNGVGMPYEQLAALNEKISRSDDSVIDPSSGVGASHSGIALSNVNRRIQLFFGDLYGIRVSSVKNTGTEVEVRIPYA